MRRRDPQELIAAALAGDRMALGRVLSLVEAGGVAAAEVDTFVHYRGGSAYTVGITGAPGAGKSTLTDRLISAARRLREQVAVLAIDPSSPLTGGAILGDRVRMDEHFLDPGVCIRSMATRGALGGLTVAVPGAARVLDAAGFDWILMETVGVGQVEVDIAAAADTTIVVVNPGWGDAVQAVKAGLIEIADIFVVNKADRPGAAQTEADLRAAKGLSGHGPEAWSAPVLCTVASNGDGVAEVWSAVGDHRRFLTDSGQLQQRRLDRDRQELQALVHHLMAQRAEELCEGPEFARLSDAVAARSMDPRTAAAQLTKPS